MGSDRSRRRTRGRGRAGSASRPPGEPPAVESPALESPAVELPAIESPALESPAFESSTVDPPALESPAAEATAPGRPATDDATPRPAPPTGDADRRRGAPSRRRRPAARADERNGRDAGADRGLREIVGAGPSQLGVSGALRGRDVNRPTDEDVAAAERDVVIVRRHWRAD